VADRVVPLSWVHLHSWEELERRRRQGGLIVILDNGTQSHYHAASCEHVAERHFETKRANDWGNGAYYWIARPEDAAGYAVACDDCAA
jgi:hypothetical protein